MSGPGEKRRITIVAFTKAGKWRDNHGTRPDGCGGIRITAERKKG